MKKFSQIILYGCFFLFFTSCKKDTSQNQSGFNGHVVLHSILKDENSQMTMTQGVLQIYKTPSATNGSAPVTEVLVASDTVDENGVALVEFDATEDYNYVARAISFNPYFNYMNDPNIEPDYNFRKAGEFHHNFKMHRAAWVWVTLKNISPKNVANLIALTSSDPKPFVGYNLVNDTTFLMRVFSGGDSKMRYKVDNSIDSCFKWTVANWDTINYTLKY